MKRTIAFFILSLLLGQLSAQPIEKFFKLKWKTSIGVTTYRTNMLFDPVKKQIIIGSNGEDRKKLGDQKDGVYFINPKDGKIIMQLEKPSSEIDGDINGVALDGDKVFFGGDGKTFYCYQNSKKLWEYNAEIQDTQYQGDIETCPALADLNSDEKKDVVFAIENYGLMALDGTSGKVIWELSEKTKGIPSYGLNSPALFDINKDGTKDIIWGTRPDNNRELDLAPVGDYGDLLLAINGKNGEVIWSYTIHSAIHASPFVFTKNNETKIAVAETYSEIHILNTSGEIIEKISQGVPMGGISAFFSSPVITPDNIVLMGTSWWGKDDGVWMIDLDQPEETKQFTKTGTVSSSAISADVTKSPGNEIMICTEKGELLVYSEKGALLNRLQLPAGAEATPFVANIQGSKKNELLIASLDGYLYCYETQGKKKEGIKQFRVDNRNTGNVVFD